MKMIMGSKKDAPGGKKVSDLTSSAGVDKAPVNTGRADKQSTGNTVKKDDHDSDFDTAHVRKISNGYVVSKTKIDPKSGMSASTSERHYEKNPFGDVTGVTSGK